jgi:tetratricopeptide (TPR) repeat protein
MRRAPYRTIAVVALLVALGAGAAPDLWAASSRDADSRRDLTQNEAASALESVFESRPNEALSYLQTLEPQSAGGPLFHIIRARCYQEFIPMDDDNTDAGRQISVPALEDLDRAIDACTRRMDSGDTNPDLLLYRGWAWMAKAYVRSMTRDLYGAGRDAKRGKKDLDVYLALHPDDPTAKGLLGAFLYFADTIPSAFKFLSKLLMLPTGDRDKGLEYLQTAVRGGGLLETDWKLILYNVYFYFEGRFEEGLAGLEEMLREYPEYARTAIPIAMSRPYAPYLAVQSDQLVDRTVNLIYSAPNREVDWNALYLVQLFRAVGDRYCNQTKSTEARLRSIIHESPRHPDWLSGYARLELGRLCASRGDRDEAVSLFESVAAFKGFDDLHKEAEKLLHDVGKFPQVFAGPRLPDMDSWVWALYRSSPDSLAGLKNRFAGVSSRSLAAKFYVSECDLLSGDFDDALKGFTDVISVEAPAWDQTYQMIASTRIAEIYAARGFYQTAARYQGVALSYYHGEYLVDWVMEGRQRYFERLAEGKETTPPTLLTANFGAARPPKPSSAKTKGLSD